MAVKLNIGAGPTEIDGWIPVDRKVGLEAYPLPMSINTSSGESVTLGENSVDEIRASHILEHFTFSDAQAALKDWARVLKPGGRMRIAVPDVDKVLSLQSDPLRLFYLMGGQTDPNDIHKSAYDENRLRDVMIHAGLSGIKRWTSENTDCASLPVSLNLEGIKPESVAAEKSVQVKIAAYMTLARYVAAAPRAIIETALKPFKIGLTTTQGVFYGQCMQRMFNKAIEHGIDWILTLDSDSLITPQHVSDLMDEFANHPEADAMAALQCRRGKPHPLMTVGRSEEVETTGEPIKATTAHFGMTLIRVDALKTVPKPWFVSEPDADGEWGDERLDDDIWFWHQWRLANKTIYVTPRVSIGHMDEMVNVFDDQLKPQTMYFDEWRQKFQGVNTT